MGNRSIAGQEVSKVGNPGVTIVHSGVEECRESLAINQVPKQITKRTYTNSVDKLFLPHLAAFGEAEPVLLECNPPEKRARKLNQTRHLGS